MQYTRLVVVVGFDMRKIPNDRGDQPCTDRLEPVLGDLYSLTGTGRICILVLLIIRLAEVGLDVQWKNKRPKFVVQSLTLRASSVLVAHNVAMLHVVYEERCANLPAMVYFSVGIRPESAGINDSSRRKSRDYLPQYVGENAQHLMDYIPWGSVIGCAFPLDFWWHQEEGKHNVCMIAVYVQYRGMDIPNCEIDQPGFAVAGKVGELHLNWSPHKWTNCCLQGKSIMRLPPPVLLIHRWIESIT